MKRGRECRGSKGIIMMIEGKEEKLTRQSSYALLSVSLTYIQAVEGQNDSLVLQSHSARRDKN